MKLASAAVTQLGDALLDAFSGRSDYGEVARRMDTRIDDLAGQDADNREMVVALIEHAERTDRVDRLVEGARALNPDNRLLADVDVAALPTVLEPADAVRQGRGEDSFKDRLVEGLSRLDDPRLAALAGAEFAALLADAEGDDAVLLTEALIGAVRTTMPEDATRAVVPVLADALRRRLGSGARAPDVEVNLSRARIPGIDLARLDLHEGDLAFADLRRANLESVNLWRSRAIAVDVSGARLSRGNLEEVRWHRAIGRSAHFHDCRMVSAFFKDAVLPGAEFYQSRLQGAHFERADLRGARFEGANLADAYFEDATIDAAAASSIAKARNWEQAIFDAAAGELVARRAAG